MIMMKTHTHTHTHNDNNDIFARDRLKSCVQTHHTAHGLRPPWRLGISERRGNFGSRHAWLLLLLLLLLRINCYVNITIAITIITFTTVWHYCAQCRQSTAFDFHGVDPQKCC